MSEPVKCGGRVACQNPARWRIETMGGGKADRCDSCVLAALAPLLFVEGEPRRPISLVPLPPAG